MKVKTICSIKELVVFKDKNAKKVLINLIDTITKKIYKKTKYFTIHVNPNNKKNIKNYLKIGFKPSYLFLGKRVKSIKVLNKQDIKIRLATHKDFDELVKLNQLFELEESKIAGKDDFWRSYLDKELVENDIKNLLKNKNNYYFVAENSQGKIVGFLNALLEETSPITKIKRVCGMKILYVLPKYRGKQISSKLMTAMEKNIIKKTKHFVISVSPNNKKAIIIYSKKGFNSLYLCLGKKHK